MTRLYTEHNRQERGIAAMTFDRTRLGGGVSLVT